MANSNNSLGILLRTLLDQNSKKNVTTEVDNLVKTLQNKLGNLKINIGGTGLQQLVAQLNQISKLTKNIGIPQKGLGVQFEHALKTTIKNLESGGRKVTATWDEFGRTVLKVTNEATGKTEKYNYQWTQLKDKLGAVRDQLVRINREQTITGQSVEKLQAKYQGMINTLSKGKLGKFVDSNELKALENALKNIRVVDGKITTDLQNKFNTLKQNAQQLADKNKQMADESARAYKIQIAEQMRLNRLKEQKSNQNLNEELRAYRLKNQEAASLLRNQQRIELAQKDAVASATKLKQQYAGLYDNTRLNAYLNSINKLNPASKNLTHQIKLLNREFNSIKADAIANGLNNANKSAISFGESIKLITYKFTTWLLVGNALMGFYRQIGEGITFIKDLDMAMVNLKKVTDETEATYKRFAQTASRIGNEFARTTTEVIDATTNFTKMGYSLRDATELAKTALVTSNVGDIQDMNTASMYLITNLKAYNIEAKDSIKIIDVLNSLQNQHATTVEVLGEGLKRTANSMQLAGASMEQTAAMITAVQAVSQRGGEVIGNALRTISFRLRGIDEESGELVPELDKDLEKVGVRLKTVDGEFRNIYEVLKDLSKVYPSLDSFTQASLLEKIAGKRQGEVLATLLSNFAESELALKHALDSSGSAMRENEVFMDSVNAKLKELRLSMEELYLTFMSSDSLLGFINIADKLVHAFSSVSSNIGGINTLLLILGTTLLLTSTKVKAFSASLTAGMFNAFGLSLFNLHVKLMLLTKSAVATRIAISALRGAMTLGVGLALGFAIEGVLGLVTAYGEATKKQKEYFSELSSSAKSVQQDINSSKELISVYNELSNKTNLTSQEKNKLLDITNKLAQAIPNAVTQYDLEGNAIALNREELQKYIELKEEELRQKREDLKMQFYAETDTNVSSLRQKRERLKEVTEELKLQQSILERESNRPNGHVGYIQSAQAAIEKLRTKQQTLLADMGELTTKVKSQSEAFLTLNENIEGLSKSDITKITDMLFDSIDSLGTKSFKGLFQSFVSDKNITDSIRNISSAIEDYKSGNVGAEETQKKVNDQLKNLQGILINLGADPEKVKDFIDSFKPENIRKVNNEVNNLSVSLDDLNKSIDNIKSINSALQEFADNGKFNIETILKLAETHKQLLGLLGDETALREELITIRDQEVKEAERQYLDKISFDDNFYKTIKNNIINYLSNLKGFQDIDLSKAKNLAQAKLVVESTLIKKLKDMWSDYYDATTKTFNYNFAELQANRNKIAATGGDTALLDRQLSEMREIIDTSAEAKRAIDNIALSGAAVDFSGVGISNKSSSLSKENKADDQYWSSVTNKMKNYDNILQKIIKSRELLAEGSKAMRDNLNEENFIRSEKIKFLKQEIEQQKKLVSQQSKTIKTIPTSTSPGKGQAIIDIAETALGTNYKWGGNDLKIGVDCSGLVQQAYKQVSIDVPRVAQDQYNASNVKITNKKDLQKGDLVFFGKGTNNITHVGIYAGDGKMIEAPRTGDVVKYSSIDRANYVGGGRYSAVGGIGYGSTNGALTDYNEAQSRLNDLIKELQEEESRLYESVFARKLDQIKEYDNSIQNLTDSISLAEAKLGLFDEGTAEYNKALIEQIEGNKQLIEQLKIKEQYLRQELVNEQLSIAQKEQLTQVLNEVTKAQIDAQVALRSKLSSIADEIVNIEKSALELLKQAKQDEVNEKIKAEEKYHDTVIKGYEDDLKAFEKSVNDKKRLLADASSERSYNQELSDLQKEQLEIQKKIDSKQLDDSIEARKELADLRKQLSDKVREIENLQYNRSKELQEQNLDDQLKNYQEQIDAKKEQADEEFDETKNSLDKQKKYWEKYYDNLLNDERHWASIRENILNGHLDTIKSDLDSFASQVDRDMSGIGKSIKQNVIDKFAQAQDIIGQLDSSNNKPPSGSGSNSTSLPAKTFYSPDKKHSYYVDENAQIYKDGRHLSLTAEQLKALSGDPGGSSALEYARKIKENRKHEGGFVNAIKPPNKMSEIVHKLFNTKGNEQLTLALQDEFFSPQKNIMQNFIPNMKNFVSSIQQPQLAGAGGLHFDSLLTVNGNVDRAIMPQLEDLVNRAANKVADTFKKNLNMSGVYRRV